MTAKLKNQQENNQLIQIILIAIVFILFTLTFQNPIFPITSIATVALTFLGMFYPRASFFAFLTLVVFVDFLKRLQLAFTDPTTLEWNLVTLLPDIALISSFAGVILRNILKDKMVVHIKKADWWLLAFIISSLFSILYSWLPLHISLSSFKLKAFYILVYFLTPVLIITRKHLERLLGTTFVLAVIVSLYGLWQSVSGMMPFEERWLYEGYTGLDVQSVISETKTLRPFSTMNSPHAYSFYLVIGLVCGWTYLQISKQSNIKKSISILSIMVLIIALLTSLARSAILLFFLTIFFAKYPSFRYFLLTIVIIILLTFFLVDVSEEIRSLSNDYTDSFVQDITRVGTLGDRTLGWAGLVNPEYWTLFGYGLGTSDFTLLRKFDLSITLFSHDNYTSILVEQGIVGIISFIGFLTVWYRNTHHRLSAQEKHPQRIVSQYLLGFCIAMLIVGLLGKDLGVRPINIYFWIFVSLLYRTNILTEITQE